MNPSQNSRMYKVKRPDGQIWDIPEENVQKAISLGGRVIDDSSPSANETSPQKMIKVKRPDGQIWEVPEKNLDKAISLGGEVVQEENKTEGENPHLRSLARGTRNAIAGTADTLDFIASPVRAGINAIGKPFGYNVPSLAEETTKGIDTLTGGMTAPRNDTERTEEAFQRGIGGMPLGAGIGLAGKAIKSAPALIRGIPEFIGKANVINPANVGGAGATAGLVQSHLNENPEDIAGAASKGFIAPAIQTGLELLTRKGRTVKGGQIGKALQLEPSKVESFREAKITPSLADVTKSAPIKVASQYLQKYPLVGTPLRNLNEKQYNQILRGLEQESGNLSRTKGSELVMKGSKAVREENTDLFDNMFSNVEKDINKMKDNTVTLKPVNEAIDTITRNFSTESMVDDFKKSPLGKEFTDLYNTSIEFGSGIRLKELKKLYPKEFTDGEPSTALYEKFGGKVPYWHMKHVLKKINNKITTYGQIGDEDQGELKYLAKSIASSIEENMTPRFKDLGPKSFENWIKHKPLYSEYAEDIIPNLNKMLRKDKEGAISAFKDMVLNQKNAGLKTEIVLKGLNSDDKLELVNSINKEMGRNADGTFNPLKWSTTFEGLEESQKKILLSPLSKGSQKKVQAISDSIKNIKSTLKEANTSGTAYHNALQGLTATAATAATYAAMGTFTPAASLLLGLAMGRIPSELMSNQKVINWLYKGVKSKNLNQFEKNLHHIPHVGKYRKTLVREMQAFDRDIKDAKDEKKGPEKKKIMNISPQGKRPAVVSMEELEH